MFTGWKENLSSKLAANHYSSSRNRIWISHPLNHSNGWLHPPKFKKVTAKQVIIVEVDRSTRKKPNLSPSEEFVLNLKHVFTNDSAISGNDIEEKEAIFSVTGRDPVHAHARRMSWHPRRSHRKATPAHQPRNNQRLRQPESLPSLAHAPS
jgi:hypothetical protein